MMRFSCSACNALMESSESKAGQKIACPKCGQRLQIPAAPKRTVLARSEPSPVQPPQRLVPPRQEVIEYNPALEFDPGVPPPLPRDGVAGTWRFPAILAISGAFLTSVASGIVGLVMSQYWPVFGGIIEKNFAAPMSEARLSLVPIHLLVFCTIGLACGGALGFLIGLAARR